MALAGLLIGSVLALWLLIRPPSTGDTSAVIQTGPSATPALTPQGSGSPATSTPTAKPTAAPTAKPTAAPTAEPTAAPTAPPATEYVVQEGDTWNGIAAAFGVDAAELAAVNGLDLEYVLQPGDVLVIP